jgi:hypothetical protein
MLEVTHSLYHFSSAVRLGNEQSPKWELVASGCTVASYDDDVYGALATHVARHERAADGPLRELYLVGPPDTSDESAWRTEIGWPIVKD